VGYKKTITYVFTILFTPHITPQFVPFTHRSIILKSGIKNYPDKQRVVNTFISDIDHTISDGLEFNPHLVKKRYKDLKKQNP